MIQPRPLTPGADDAPATNKTRASECITSNTPKHAVLVVASLLIAAVPSLFVSLYGK